MHYRQNLYLVCFDAISKHEREAANSYLVGSSNSTQPADLWIMKKGFSRLVDEKDDSPCCLWIFLCDVSVNLRKIQFGSRGVS